MSSSHYKKFRPPPLQIKKEVEDIYIPVFPVYTGMSMSTIEETNVGGNDNLRAFSPVSFQLPDSISSLSSLSSFEELVTLRKLDSSKKASPKRGSPAFNFE